MFPVSFCILSGRTITYSIFCLSLLFLDPTLLVYTSRAGTFYFFLIFSGDAVQKERVLVDKYAFLCT